MFIAIILHSFILRVNGQINLTGNSTDKELVDIEVILCRCPGISGFVNGKNRYRFRCPAAVCRIHVNIIAGSIFTDKRTAVSGKSLIVDVNNAIFRCRICGAENISQTAACLRIHLERGIKCFSGISGSNIAVNGVYCPERNRGRVRIRIGNIDIRCSGGVGRITINNTVEKIQLRRVKVIEEQCPSGISSGTGILIPGNGGIDDINIENIAFYTNCSTITGICEFTSGDSLIAEDCRIDNIQIDRISGKNRYAAAIYRLTVDDRDIFQR